MLSAGPLAGQGGRRRSAVCRGAASTISNLTTKKPERLLGLEKLVPKGGFEPPLGNPNYALNVARLPFRHFGSSVGFPTHESV